MNLESPKVSVQKSAADTFAFLTDIKNFEKLMPANTAKFEMISDDSFVFALSGMPEIKLKLVEKTPNSKVVLNSPSEKLNFSLSVLIDEAGENQSEVQLLFEGEFNSMISMMIKSPISKFIESLATNLSKQ
jgi:carbon monoxide dehydrogenase subunit G